MAGRLAGKVAIVTGSASGIGRATAHAIAFEGGRVVIADLNGDGAEEVAQEITAAGGEASAQQTDVADEGAIVAMIGAAVRRYGGLDVLHNNAAASDPELMGADTDVATMDVAVWDTAFAVNCRGVMLGCKHAIPAMLKRGGGSIVNTSSASGSTGDLALPAYSASKAGLNSLTRSVATQYGKQGIRCNAIAPGVIETPALRANISEEQLALYESNHLTPRLGRPEDIAAAVVFLASDEAAFITGQLIAVDGGLLSHHPALAQTRALMASK